MATQAHTHQAHTPLTIQQALPLARSLARREAHSPDDVDDLIQVAIFAYHKAAQRTSEVDNPYAHARTVLQRAMWGYYSSNAVRFNEQDFLPLPEQQTECSPFLGSQEFRMSPSQRERYGVALGQFASLYSDIEGQKLGATQPELFELEDYFEALERNCGRLARDIVVNLISPCGECSKKILAEVERKRRRQHCLRSASVEARRKQPRGVQNEIRLSQRVVRNALGLTPSEWNRNMTRIKDFTRTWLAR